MLKTKLNTVIFVPLGDIKAVEKEAFLLPVCGGGAETEESLRGGYGL